jgi:osmotically-inducible protein OsmY
MKSCITSLGLPAALLSASLFAGCQNTARGVEEDTEKNTAAAQEQAREATAEAERRGDSVAESAKSAADRAADATRDAADRAADATRDAGREIAGATREATGDAKQSGREVGTSFGNAIDAAQMTMQVKTALIDADNVDAVGIDVDTNASAKTVTLKGHVPTAAQKATAEKVATTKAQANGYRVVNNLTIRS